MFGHESGGTDRWRAASALTAAAITLVLGFGILLPRLADGGQRLLEGAALFAVFSTPAMLALLSLNKRPILLLVAAVLGGTTSLLLGTLMPVLALPALVYAAYAKQRAAATVVSLWLVVGAPMLLVIAGAMSIYLSTEETCTTTTAGGGTATECRETTTSGAGIGAIILTAMAVPAAFVLTTPTRLDSDGSSSATPS